MIPWEEGLIGLTALAYLVAMVAYFHFFYFHEGLRASRTLATAAWVLHGAALGLHMLREGRAPLFALGEAILFLTWVVVLNEQLLERLLGMPALGAFVLPFAFLLLAILPWLPRAQGLALEPTGWLALHVVVAVVAYGALFLAGVSALMYLLQERQLRLKAFRITFRRLPPLATLDDLTHRLVVLGWLLLGAAILTGALWASEAWGSFWSWEPKELWTFFTWFVFGGYLGLRNWSGWRGRRAALVLLAGFAALLLNLFVVNGFDGRHLFLA